MSSIVDRRNTGTKRDGKFAVRKSLWVRTCGFRVESGKVGDFGRLGSELGSGIKISRGAKVGAEIGWSGVLLRNLM